MKILISLIIVSIGLTVWNNNQNPFPQFTQEEMQQICIQEGIE